MRSMTLEELYDKLCSEEFKNTENDIFYNFFIYQYPPQEEYAMRKKIEAFKAQLIRPVNYVDVLTIDLFKEFCNFLDGQAFGKKHPSYLKYMLEKDGNDHDAVTASLTNKANSPQFYQYLHERIMRHISIDDDKLRPYVFLYGIGSIYPYLRTSHLLANYEQYNKSNRYKIIVFYPGEKEGNTFRLFNRVDDQHTYRATLLINE